MNFHTSAARKPYKNEFPRTCFESRNELARISPRLSNADSSVSVSNVTACNNPAMLTALIRPQSIRGGRAISLDSHDDDMILLQEEIEHLLELATMAFERNPPHRITRRDEASSPRSVRWHRSQSRDEETEEEDTMVVEDRVDQLIEKLWATLL